MHDPASEGSHLSSIEVMMRAHSPCRSNYGPSLYPRNCTTSWSLRDGYATIQGTYL
jgi:hypothetical protein